MKDVIVEASLVEALDELKRAIDRARAEILEEAATVAEEYPSREYADIPVIRGIASAIRALKESEHD